ncbi:unnamed protein product [Trifolium pratense]|uniref:Uncharacterized protein n=1 Tax=Trifolium pratense TaxID=57577 RepID=A0ACB0KRH0_TRIPR|nr:unnamed protein product [Trifolium pratense]
MIHKREGDSKGSVRNDGSGRRDQVGHPGQNAQFVHQGSLNYIDSQLELRILAHLTNCKSMLEAFEAGGDFHSRTAMNMYLYIRQAVDNKEVLFFSFDILIVMY